MMLIFRVWLCVWGGRGGVTDDNFYLAVSWLNNCHSLLPAWNSPPPFFWVCVCVLVTRSYKGLWVSVCGPALSQVCTRGWCTRSLFLPPALHNTWESLKNFWRNFTQSYSDLESPKKKNVMDFSVSGLLCSGRLRRVCFHARGVRLGRHLLRLGGQGPEELRGLSDGRTEADGRARLPVADGQLYVCHHGALQPGWGKENPCCAWKKVHRRGREQSQF